MIVSLTLSMSFITILAFYHNSKEKPNYFVRFNKNDLLPPLAAKATEIVYSLDFRCLSEKFTVFSELKATEFQ